MRERKAREYVDCPGETMHEKVHALGHAPRMEAKLARIYKGHKHAEPRLQAGLLVFAGLLWQGCWCKEELFEFLQTRLHLRLLPELGVLQ